MGYDERARTRKATDGAKDAPGSKNGGYPESSAVPGREVGPAGFWLNDGGWCQTKTDREYWEAPSGSMTRGVRQLVWLRRQAFPEPTPRDIAMAIEEHRLGAGFPNRNQWVDAKDWEGCEISTSAEAAVAFARAIEASPIGATPEPPCDPSRAKFYTGAMWWFLSQPVWPSWDQVTAWMDSTPMAFVNPPDDWLEIIERVWKQCEPGTKPSGMVEPYLSAHGLLAEALDRGTSP